MNTEPLWLPKGSIRAIMALGLAGSTIYSVLSGGDPLVLGTLTGVVVAFYFKTREGAA